MNKKCVLKGFGMRTFIIIDHVSKLSAVFEAISRIETSAVDARALETPCYIESVAHECLITFSTKSKCKHRG